MLPYFKRGEDQSRGRSTFHGVGGPLKVSDLRYVNPMVQSFLDACEMDGLALNEDFNDWSRDQEGFGKFQVREWRKEGVDTAIDGLFLLLFFSLLTGIESLEVLDSSVLSLFLPPTSFPCARCPFIYWTGWGAVGFFFRCGQVTQREGSRETPATSYLREAMTRKNVTVETGVIVEKIDIVEGELGEGSKHKATGVTVINKNGYRESIKARKEVLLAGKSIPKESFVVESCIIFLGWIS